jgi:hypothetical protein
MGGTFPSIFRRRDHSQTTGVLLHVPSFFSATQNPYQLIREASHAQTSGLSHPSKAKRSARQYTLFSVDRIRRFR